MVGTYAAPHAAPHAEDTESMTAAGVDSARSGATAAVSRAAPK